jgi:peptide-methionine (S)-S-oxide reductase
VIFTHDDRQKALAGEYKKKLDESGAFSRPIVTEISPAPKFTKAEEYHQNYFRSNPDQSYCRFVVGPKVEKFRQVFPEKLQKK